MKKLLSLKSTTIAVDILLLLSLVVFFVLKDYEKLWQSAHCIFSSFWILLMGVHIHQHRNPTNKSKINAVITLGFVIITLSVLFFCFGFNTFFLTFHKIAGILFILLIIIHTVSKFKQFITLFKRENTTL